VRVDVLRVDGEDAAEVLEGFVVEAVLDVDLGLLEELRDLRRGGRRGNAARPRDRSAGGRAAATGALGGRAAMIGALGGRAAMIGALGGRAAATGALGGRAALIGALGGRAAMIGALGGRG